MVQYVVEISPTRSNILNDSPSALAPTASAGGESFLSGVSLFTVMAHPVSNVLLDVSDETRAKFDGMHSLSRAAALCTVQSIVALLLAKLARTNPVVEGARFDRLRLDLMAAAGAESPPVLRRSIRLEILHVPAFPANPRVVFLVHTGIDRNLVHTRPSLHTFKPPFPDVFAARSP